LLIKKWGTKELDTGTLKLNGDCRVERNLRMEGVKMRVNDLMIMRQSL